MNHFKNHCKRIDETTCKQLRNALKIINIPCTLFHSTATNSYKCTNIYTKHKNIETIVGLQSTHIDHIFGVSLIRWL